jgi:glycosyltransferase involved in cell wall biosynthesis
LQQSHPAAPPPEVSVIIACRNGADTLGAALDSLAAQAWDRPWEVVFADNGSTDASRAIFDAFAARHPGMVLRALDIADRKGKPHALNVAIRAARGRAILFCDADDTVAPGWLAAMGAALETRDFVAARVDVTALNPDWVFASRPPHQSTGLRTLSYAPFCVAAGGATLGFSRRLFEAVGGFDPDFAALEDTDFCIRAHLKGFELTFVPEAVYNYRYRSSPGAIYAQARHYAHYRALLHRRYGPGTPFLKPDRWLAVSRRLGRLALSRLAAPVKRWDPLDRARFSLQFGQTVGEISGAIAFRVAPPAGGPRGRRGA